MRIRRYLTYWALAALTLTFGTFILASMLVCQRELRSVNRPSSYVGYVSLVWHGGDRLRDGDTTLSSYATDVFCLVLPYLLIAIGIWLGIVGYRRRKAESIIVQGFQVGNLPPQADDETVWPPPLKRG